MKTGKNLILGIVVVLVTTLPTTAAAPNLDGVCMSGEAYDPACDVNHNGSIDIVDIQLTASHWGQAGIYNIYPAMVPRTGQIVSQGPSDDGALQRGIVWPVPRFTDNLDGTVTDNLTGLVWLQDASCPGPMNWVSALEFANALYDGWTGAGGSDCGLSDNSEPGDWRLPNIRELHSLVDFRRSGPALPQPHAFTDVQNAGVYWSSTTLSGVPGNAWLLTLTFGDPGTIEKHNLNDVWPVRGGR